MTTASRKAHEPLPNALAYTVPDACRMVGVGKTKLYELRKRGRLRFIHVDGRTLVGIPVAMLEPVKLVNSDPLAEIDPAVIP